MAKPSQTFKKRQREHKLREKAQMKRERRQQRRDEKKSGGTSGSGVESWQPEQQDDSLEPVEAD